MNTDKCQTFIKSPEDSEYIYHYTNLKGAVGILSERQLWMTNIRCLNDWMEGRYFYDPLLKMIGEDSEHIDKLSEIHKRCLDNTYIASLSSVPDLLSQYKYYGNICIAFDPLEIDESRRVLNNNPTSGFESSRKVDYCSNENYSKAISEFAKDENLIEAVVKEDMYSLLRFFCFLGFIKHPGFSEENETRICHFWYTPREVKYRSSGERHIPYIEFKLLPTAIRKIIVGPSLDQRKIADNLLEVIEGKEELQHLDIVYSEIPFIPH